MKTTHRDSHSCIKSNNIQFQRHTSTNMIQGIHRLYLFIFLCIISLVPVTRGQVAISAVGVIMLPHAVEFVELHTFDTVPDFRQFTLKSWDGRQYKGPSVCLPAGVHILISRDAEGSGTNLEKDFLNRSYPYSWQAEESQMRSPAYGAVLYNRDVAIDRYGPQAEDTLLWNRCGSKTSCYVGYGYAARKSNTKPSNVFDIADWMTASMVFTSCRVNSECSNPFPSMSYQFCKYSSL